MGLETYLPQPRVVVVGGKEIAVTPLRVRQIPAFARAITPVAGFITRGDLLGAMAVAGDDLIDAVTVASGESREWIGELLADDLVTLAGAVIEVNRDFFVQRVAPKIHAVTASMTQNMTNGATSSPSSSPTDTV